MPTIDLEAVVAPMAVAALVAAPEAVVALVAAPEAVVASEVAVSVVAPVEAVVASAVAVSEVVAPEAVVVVSEVVASAAAPVEAVSVVDLVVDSAVVAPLEVLAAAVVVALLWCRNIFMFMYHHQSPRNLVPVPIYPLVNPRNTTRLSSLRLHLLLPTRHPSSPYNLKTKKRLWSMCWSRNQKINRILLFPLQLPLNPPNQKFTSSNTRPKRMAAAAVVLEVSMAVPVVVPEVVLVAVLEAVLAAALAVVLEVVLAVVAAVVVVTIWVVVPAVVAVLLPLTMDLLANLDPIKSLTTAFGKNALLTFDLCFLTHTYTTG